MPRSALTDGSCSDTLCRSSLLSSGTRKTVEKRSPDKNGKQLTKTGRRRQAGEDEQATKRMGHKRYLGREHQKKSHRKTKTENTHNPHFSDASWQVQQFASKADQAEKALCSYPHPSSSAHCRFWQNRAVCFLPHFAPSPALPILPCSPLFPSYPHSSFDGCRSAFCRIISPVLIRPDISGSSQNREPDF